MKIQVIQKVKNVLNKECVQSVNVEIEEDGTEWAIINHDGNEISLSVENLRNLNKNISTSLNGLDHIKRRKEQIKLFSNKNLLGIFVLFLVILILLLMTWIF